MDLWVSLVSAIAKSPESRLALILKNGEVWFSVKMFWTKKKLSNLVAGRYSSFRRGRVRCWKVKSW